jgi:hypothetical protein
VPLPGKDDEATSIRKKSMLETGQTDEMAFWKQNKTFSLYPEYSVDKHQSYF